MRVMPSPVFQKLVSSLGGSPTPISFGELYGALKNKTVDGQNNALSLVDLFKYYQVQKYATIDNHVYAVSAMLINNQFYQALPDDLQKVIDNAQKVALAVNRGVSRYTDHQAADNLRAKGMEVNALTPENREKFKAIGPAGGVGVAERRNRRRMGPGHARRGRGRQVRQPPGPGRPPRSGFNRPEMWPVRPIP